MDLRTYVDTESNSSYMDPPSMESSSTVPKQNYSPTPPYAETPPNSPQIENPLPAPCGNFKGSLKNQEAIFKVSEALSSLQKPGEGHEEFQNSLTTSTERVPANTIKPSAQPQSDNISGTTSPTIKRLPVTDLLNVPSRAEHVQPLRLPTMKTLSSGPPVIDTGLGKLQCEMPAGLQPHIQALDIFQEETLKSSVSGPSKRNFRAGFGECFLQQVGFWTEK
ncbi:hypothetical protein BJ878DRAFT_544225 [Calycina marina]|uniref:Uncharacterized protein n=1 Tax=Calycina marina TaxID=1763456 RepID=A0A9P7YZA4_9HELO|nr:hypothetical protein BJ878DRAFT_544225 [Calycina marina]